MSAHTKNLAASVHQKLLNLSRERDEPFHVLLIRYGIERLLYRLSQSSYCDLFLLKGAMLFSVWKHFMPRISHDLDLSSCISVGIHELKNIFIELCSLPVISDGLIFQPNTMYAQAIRENAQYSGIRIAMIAILGKAKIPIQVDVGFGDAITPAPENVVFPALLNFPAPQVRSYPRYTVIAEKTEAMISLGDFNSRMKDFYDLWFLSQHFEFDGNILIEALRNTFLRRKTLFPLERPIALTDRFASTKSDLWKAFAQKNNLLVLDFNNMISALRNFIEPPLLAAQNKSQFSLRWVPSEYWK